MSQAVVVPGEAPETDEEDETPAPLDRPLASHGSTNRTTRSQSDFQLNNNRASRQAYKHDSLLHRKLRESHLGLAAEAAELVGKVYTKTADDLKQVTQAFQGLHDSTQDAAAKMRRVGEDLYSVQSSLDIVLSNDVLPSFDGDNFSSKYPATDAWCKAR